MKPNDVLSEQLHVKSLLKEGEKAVFVLKNFRKTDAGREELTCPEVYALSERKTVLDPFTKNRVIIGNVVGTQQRKGQDGKIWHDEVVKKVEFFRGYCTLTSEQNDTFQYLMRRPENESNPFGKRMAVNAREKTPLFSLTNDKNIIKQAHLIKDLEIECLVYIKKTASATELKTIAAKLNQHPDNRMHVKSYQPPVIEDVQAIKLELLNMAPLFAKQIIYASSSQECRLKVQVMEGLSAGVLMFVDGSYIMDDGKAIHQPKPDADKIESLVEWFMGDGQETYNKFAKALAKALKVDLTK